MTRADSDSDPRSTAYAFGELTGTEKEQFEAELARSEHARREVMEIEGTISALREELSNSSPLTLDPAQRQRIEALARAERDSRSNDQPKPPVGRQVEQSEDVVRLDARRRRSRRWVWGVSSAVAIAAGAMLLFSGAVERSLRLTSAVPMELVTDDLSLNYSGAGDALKPAHPDADFDRESYDHVEDNPFVPVATDPRSTFSIDVDTAGYALVRRHLLGESRLPPKGAVRIEELVNYFSYTYPEPEADRPFSVQTEVASAPWAPAHRLVRIGIKGRHVEPRDIPGTNLVFLIDVSGSMEDPNKLPLLKRGLSLLVEQLDERDKVSIVVYAAASGLVLPATRGSDKSTIVAALERLEAGGSTNGGEGIQLAYRTAAEHFVRGGINRVILATDGDFNVGVTSQSELVDLIRERARAGVFLSVLGFGGGNYNDSMLEKLADKGNGNYAYVDTLSEARKVLVEQATGTLITIAKDVKVQIEFNPRRVEAFRLIGYENRVLAHRDFADDAKDAGEIGADHTVTALYEIVPPGAAARGGLRVPPDDPLKYQAPGSLSAAAAHGELGTVKLRYKLPDGDKSELIEVVVRDRGEAAQPSADFRFAAAVAEFGMLLRNSPHKGSSSYDQVLSLASAVSQDQRRREFIELVDKAKRLTELGEQR